MANQWFKFYGGEYLGDPKILQLGAYERSCWLTLLCLASQSENGEIKFLSEAQLLVMSGVSINSENGESILSKFEQLDMITISNGVVTIKNWGKRQYSEGYERVKRFRDNKKVTQKSTIRIEENRIDKNRIETPLALFNSFKANPLWERLVNKYPDRDYEFIFQEMCDWWLTNKKKLPKAISSFSNWLSKTKPDPGLQAERMSQIKRADDIKKKEELEKIPQANPETLDKLREGISKLKSGIKTI